MYKIIDTTEDGYYRELPEDWSPVIYWNGSSYEVPRFFDGMSISKNFCNIKNAEIYIYKSLDIITTNRDYK